MTMEVWLTTSHPKRSTERWIYIEEPLEEIPEDEDETYRELNHRLVIDLEGDGVLELDGESLLPDEHRELAVKGFTIDPTLLTIKQFIFVDELLVVLAECGCPFSV